MIVLYGTPVGVEDFSYDSPQYGTQSGINFRMDHPAIPVGKDGTKYLGLVECRLPVTNDAIRKAADSKSPLVLLADPVVVPGKNGKRDWVKLIAKSIHPEGIKA